MEITRRLCQSCLFLFAVILSLRTSPTSGYPSFEAPPSDSEISQRLYNLVVDPVSGDLFVGGLNVIKKLTPELRDTEVSRMTGPVRDNQECPVPPRKCDKDRIDTDNINKILVLDGDRLITCGSVFQGTCQILRSSDLTMVANSTNQEIAPNTVNGTVVAFITPSSTAGEKVLFLGTSKGKWLDFDGVPTISSRQLPINSSEKYLLEIVKDEEAIGTTSKMQFPEELAANPTGFNIEYIHGFSHDHFSYFIANQPGDAEAISVPENYTKIVQICQNDKDYFSYIELPLNCTHPTTGEKYNLAQSVYVTEISSADGMVGFEDGESVLFASFSKARPNSMEPSEESAVCMYPIRKIREMFFDRRIACLNGETETTQIMWWEHGDCPTKPSSQLIDRMRQAGTGYCHDFDFVRPMGGISGYETQAVYTDSSGITAITAMHHNNDTVIFLGNQNGQVKKLRVMSATQASLYEEKNIDIGSPVAREGLRFTADQEFLYVMTHQKITKIPAAECDQYSECEQCLNIGNGVGDPFCGWCSLQPGCTRRRESECTGAESTTSHRWVHSNDACPTIEAVTPPNIPKTITPRNNPRVMVKEIVLDISNLPKPEPTQSLGYECVFGEFTPTTATVEYDADSANSKVRCSTPRDVEIDEAALTVDLGLRSTTTGYIVVSTQFDFFDCDRYSSCTECVQNDFNCDWCIFDNRCTQNYLSTCNNQVDIVSSQLNPNSSASGPDYCPQILRDHQEILIPAGVTSSITVLAANLPEVTKPSSQYKCILEYENLKAVVSAVRVNETMLQCRSKMYNYGNQTQQLDVVLSVTWGDDFVLDNPGDVKAVLYKCQVERDNCGQCLVAPDKFECGWCEADNQCTISSQCIDSTTFLHKNVLCPNPRIEKFSPIAGHVEGGTVITITGENLGRNVSDIAQIMIDGVQCYPIEGSYVPVSEVQCVTDTVVSTPKPHHGPIQIRISDGESEYTGVSDDQFKFVLPKIVDVFPIRGPSSGGTLISIMGIDMHAGSNITADVSHYPCEIQSFSPDMVTCYTTAAPVDYEGFVGVTYDGHRQEGLHKFTYMEDPTILELSRKSSIQSGNLSLIVKGTDLQYVNHTAMVFRFGDETFESPCIAFDNNEMKCMTPDVSELGLPLPYKVPREDYGFILDGVANFTSLADVGNFQPFEIVSDPVYFKFREAFPIQDASDRKYFEVNGTNLTLAYEQGDVVVTIGDQKCVKIFLTADTLTCDAPPMQPNTVIGDGLPFVTVYHGKIMTQVGQVMYRQEEFPLYIIIIVVVVGLLIIISPVYHGKIVTQVGQVKYLQEELPLYIIIIAVAVGLLIIVFFICLCTVYRRNATKNERKVKHLLQERDRLELQVAMECKEAFAELQISMNHYGRDMGAIPFLSYQQYAIRTLFPDKLDHPVLSELTVPDDHALQIKTALKEFDQLINNRTFLLLFIRTLEEQQTFMVQDKTSVASLLMVILQSKMDYCTSIIKVLLGRLIEKHVESNRAKLLMRRNESVVEKMISNWLSFLLYTFLKDSAGEPLFTLFYAIKQQVEKGPVDAITGEGRYGLSELKIIRQQIDYTPITIYARGLDKSLDAVQVKVLDTDTITQCREKILDALYQTIPFSHRPPKEDLDLVLNYGLKGFKTLQDEDESSVQDSEYKRINTLRHYDIQDGDTLSLEPRQGYNSRAYTPTSGRYATLSSTSSPTRVTSPMLGYENDSGVKYWHLVKPSEMVENGKGPGNRMMAEVYLPRLLTMKGTIQNYVDNLFETIFSVNHRGNTLPLAIKYLFDIFDDYAAHHGITDPDVVHSWKSNSLPLRFWVNLIKNPNLILDIYKSDTVDACLSIVGQCLMDACSYSDHRLTRDSPSSKLLYAKDIPNYKEWVNRYYRDIQALQQVSDQDMNALLTEHSNAHQYDFHSYSALNKLYLSYAQKYREEILEALSEDEFAQKNNLEVKFANLEDLMNNDRMDHQQITEL